MAAGCYVREVDGSAVLRVFEPNMAARYQPKVGDYWVVYDDGYQSISPQEPFEAGYVPIFAYCDQQEESEQTKAEPAAGAK